MSVRDELDSTIDRLFPRALGVGVLALGVCVVSGVFDPAQFFRSYLFAYLFWFGIALGSLAVLMVHHITGGAWGFIIRRFLEAAAMTLPLMALLFLPILFGLHSIYDWSHPDVIAAESVLQHKSHFFLNVSWFIVRAIVYFILWIALARVLRQSSLEQDKTGAPALTRRLQHLCGPGLVLYVLTVSLAAIDWIMSLEPKWFSTIFGMIIICGQALSAIAAMIVAAVWLAGGKLLSDLVEPEKLRDLGHILHAFMLLWTYMAFSQYLIIWSGDLANEAVFYVHRSQGGWQWVSLFIVVFHFFVPLTLLIFSGIKRNPRLLAGVATILLFAHLVDNFWLVQPTFYDSALRVHWMDILLPVGLGGLWIAAFIRQLRGHALIPFRDPRLAGEFIRKGDAGTWLT